MNISNVKNTIDNEYNNSLISNCTDIEKNDDIIIQSLMLVIPSGILFLCLMSIMTYTSIKPLIRKK